MTTHNERITAARAALAAYDNPAGDRADFIGDDGHPLIGSLERAEYVIRVLRAAIETTTPAQDATLAARHVTLARCTQPAGPLTTLYCAGIEDGRVTLETVTPDGSYVWEEAATDEWGDPANVTGESAESGE